MSGFDFVYAVRFSLQLLFFEGLFIYDNAKKDKFILRLMICLVAYFGVIFGVLELFKLFPNSIAPMTYPMYFAFCWLVTMVIMFVCFKIGSKQILFCGIGGYTLQHLIFSIMAIPRYFAPFATNNATLDLVLDSIIYAGIPYLIAGVEIGRASCRERVYGLV